MRRSDDDYLDDLKRVAVELNKSPIMKEYEEAGNYHPGTIARRFGGWNDALFAADLSRSTCHGTPDETLLTRIRENSANTDITPAKRFLSRHLDFSKNVYVNRFGGYWEAIVRAGRKPPTGVPISESDYDTFIQTAINAEYPSVTLFGLVTAFTGFPRKILLQFSSDWISRLDSDLQPTLITVPPEHVVGDDPWVLKAPTYYTISGEKKPTGLEPIFRWLIDTKSEMLTNSTAEGGILRRILSEADMDVEISSMRPTVAAHLARRGVSKFEIEMQVGAEKTDWERSIEDIFLYLYQFEDYCHPDYEPSGTFLNPDTGEVRDC